MTLATPYVTLDLAKVQQQLDAFHQALPGVEVFYAIKSNRHAALIKTLQEAGTGFEIASWGECRLLMELGVPASSIIYSNPIKPAGHIKAAFAAGVDRFAFDSHREIDKIAAHAPGASVYLRLAVSDHGSVFPLSSKFGCHPDEAVALMVRARQAGLRVLGLTFHVGSQCESLPTWQVAIEQCGTVMKALADASITIEVLNLGGGFPVTYVDRVPDIASIGHTVSDAIAMNLPYQPTLWAEPGRFFSASAATITTEIIGRETRRGREWLYVDMGVFQGLMECLEINDWAYPVHVEPPAPDSGDALRTFTLTGPSCDACDTLFTDIDLPANLEPGHRLRIEATGAYALEYGSTFNGFEMPTVFVRDQAKEMKSIEEGSSPGAPPSDRRLGRWPEWTPLDEVAPSEVRAYLPDDYLVLGDWRPFNLLTWSGGCALATEVSGCLAIQIPDFVDPRETLWTVAGTGVELTEAAAVLSSVTDRLDLLPEPAAAALAAGGFRVREVRDQADYVYDISTLIDRGGSRFKTFRRHLNAFTRSVEDRELEVRGFRVADTAFQVELLAIFDEWALGQDTKGADPAPQRVAIERSATAADPAAFCEGLLLYLDGRSMAAAVYEVEGTWGHVHFATYRPGLTGLSRYLWSVIAERMFARGATRMNFQQDLGLPGLRHFKEQLWPLLLLLPKFTADLQRSAGEQ